MSLVAFASDSVDVFHVVDEMTARGWYVQPQLAFGGSEKNVHLTIGPSNVRWIEALLDDLGASVQAAKALPPSEMAAAVSSAFAGLDPTAIGPETLAGMLGMAGIQGVELPERMADVHAVLDALPPAVCERLLTEFMNQLFRS